MTRQQQLIWAAGFFDGEGCVGVGYQSIRRVYKTGRLAEYNNFQLSLQVSQKVREPLDILVALFGGSVKPHKYGTGYVYWSWERHNHNAMTTLQEMLPFLVVKRAAAMNGIEFQKVHEATRPKATFARSEEDRVRLRAFWREAKRINTRNSTAVDYTKIQEKESEVSVQ